MHFLSSVKGTFLYFHLPIMSNKVVLMLYHLSVTECLVYHYCLEQAK